MPSLANRASLPARLTPTPVKPDRFGLQERPLERLRGADIGLRRAGRHHDPGPGARDGDTACRIDLARRREAVDQGWRQDGNVERRTFVDLLLNCRRQAESKDKLVAGRLLELRA